MSSADVLNATPEAGMKMTGEYPALGAPLAAETTQMTDQDAAAMGAELSGLAGSQKTGAVTEAEYRRKLAEVRAAAKDGERTSGPEN